MDVLLFLSIVFLVIWIWAWKKTSLPKAQVFNFVFIYLLIPVAFFINGLLLSNSHTIVFWKLVFLFVFLDLIHFTGFYETLSGLWFKVVLYIARGALLLYVVFTVLVTYSGFSNAAFVLPEGFIMFITRYEILLIAACLNNAILDEIIFRGILLEKLNRFIGLKPILALIVQAILFSIAGLLVYPIELLWIVGLLVFGLIMGLIQQRTKNIALPILIHFILSLIIVWG